MCVCVCVVCIYSSVDGCLGFFHVLATVYSADINIGVNVLTFFFLSSICPGVELLDHMVVVFSDCWVFCLLVLAMLHDLQDLCSLTKDFLGSESMES